jgi:hypothetical protein
MVPVTNNGNERYNNCAGNNCIDTGKSTLKIKYLNKVGDYCDSCADHLLNEGLDIRIGNPVDTTISTNTSSSRAGAQFFGIIFAGVGGVFLAIGIGYLVMFYGLLKGKGWAWTITIILLIIGIAIQIVSTSVGSVLTGFHNTNNVSSEIVGSIIGIAIDIVILYYLYRPHVKVYFGKVQAPTTVSRNTLSWCCVVCVIT